VNSDPSTALFKARQFGETLAKRLAADSRTRTRGTRQVDLLFALTRDGVVEGSTRRAFGELRTVGNRAVHGHYGEVRRLWMRSAPVSSSLPGSSVTGHR
jgi:type I restriction enzyme R subunit